MQDSTNMYCYSRNGEFYFGSFNSLQSLYDDINTLEDLHDIKVGVYKERVNWIIDGYSILEIITEMTENGDDAYFEDSVLEYAPTLNERSVTKEIEEAIGNILGKHKINYHPVRELNENEVIEWNRLVNSSSSTGLTWDI